MSDDTEQLLLIVVIVMLLIALITGAIAFAEGYEQGRDVMANEVCIDMGHAMGHYDDETETMVCSDMPEYGQGE